MFWGVGIFICSALAISSVRDGERPLHSAAHLLLVSICALNVGYDWPYAFEPAAMRVLFATACGISVLYGCAKGSWKYAGVFTLVAWLVLGGLLNAFSVYHAGTIMVATAINCGAVAAINRVFNDERTSNYIAAGVACVMCGGIAVA